MHTSVDDIICIAEKNKRTNLQAIKPLLTDSIFNLINSQINKNKISNEIKIIKWFFKDITDNESEYDYLLTKTIDISTTGIIKKITSFRGENIIKSNIENIKTLPREVLKKILSSCFKFLYYNYSKTFLTTIMPLLYFYYGVTEGNICELLKKENDEFMKENKSKNDSIEWSLKNVSVNEDFVIESDNIKLDDVNAKLFVYYDKSSDVFKVGMQIINFEDSSNSTIHLKNVNSISNLICLVTNSSVVYQNNQIGPEQVKVNCFYRSVDVKPLVFKIKDLGELIEENEVKNIVLRIYYGINYSYMALWYYFTENLSSFFNDSSISFLNKNSVKVILKNPAIQQKNTEQVLLFLFNWLQSQSIITNSIITSLFEKNFLKDVSFDFMLELLQKYNQTISKNEMLKEIIKKEFYSKIKTVYSEYGKDDLKVKYSNRLIDIIIHNAFEIRTELVGESSPNASLITYQNQQTSQNNVTTNNTSTKDTSPFRKKVSVTNFSGNCNNFVIPTLSNLSSISHKKNRSMNFNTENTQKEKTALRTQMERIEKKLQLERMNKRYCNGTTKYNVKSSYKK